MTRKGLRNLTIITIFLGCAVQIFFALDYAYILNKSNTEWKFERTDQSHLEINGTAITYASDYTVFKTTKGFVAVNFKPTLSLGPLCNGTLQKDPKVLQVWTCKDSIQVPDDESRIFWVRLLNNWAQTDPDIRPLAQRYNTRIE